MARFVERNVPEEGVNRCQADVPAAGANAAVFLKVIQEDSDGRSIQVTNGRNRVMLSVGNSACNGFNERCVGQPVKKEEIRLNGIVFHSLERHQSVPRDSEAAVV